MGCYAPARQSSPCGLSCRRRQFSLPRSSYLKCFTVLVRYSLLRSTCASSSARSSNPPAGPTNGNPCASSCEPGCSPINMMAGVVCSGAENRLRRVLPQSAGATVACLATQRGEAAGWNLAYGFCKQRLHHRLAARPAARGLVHGFKPYGGVAWPGRRTDAPCLYLACRHRLNRGYAAGDYALSSSLAASDSMTTSGVA